MIRVGVIGLGIGATHVRAIERSELAKVVALCDFNKDKLRDVSSLWPKVRCTADADEIIDAEDIDLVSIASYDETHASYALRAILQGKHVFVEKPAVLTFRELGQLREALKNNPKVRLGSNHVLRTIPLFKKIKQKISAGDAGEVYAVEADYLWGRAEKLNGWRARTPNYSLTLGAGIHMVDLVMWLLNKQPTSVFALGNRIAGKDSALTANTLITMLMKFSDGLVAKISAHGACIHPHFHNLTIYGDRETIHHSYAKSMVISSCEHNAEPSIINGEYPAKGDRDNLLINFVHSLDNASSKSMVTSEDIFSALAVCLAADQSLIEKMPISIEYQTPQN